jgi:uncharacterized protein with HEPN domain
MQKLFMRSSVQSDLFRLGHLMECIDKITFLVDSCKNVEDFKSKWIVQDAMLRNFEIEVF